MNLGKLNQQKVFKQNFTLILIMNKIPNIDFINDGYSEKIKELHGHSLKELTS